MKTPSGGREMKPEWKPSRRPELKYDRGGDQDKAADSVGIPVSTWRGIPTAIAQMGEGGSALQSRRVTTGGEGRNADLP